MNWLLVALSLAPLAPFPGLTVRHAARSIQPGEIVVLKVAGAEFSVLDVEIFGKRFPCYAGTGARQWECLIGIDLETAPGQHTARFFTDGRESADTYELTVAPKAFPERRLTVDEKFVTPPAETLARIERESKRVREILAVTTPDRLWAGTFRVPVPGAVISAFGKRSILNGKPRGAHAGTDFRGSTGTPIRAPNRGRVVLAGDLYYSGGTVILDHGMGLYSYFAHLSRISVKEGELVPRGSPVGAIGATGRVTGPHLHWSVRLVGTRVDPMSLLAAFRPSAPTKRPKNARHARPPSPHSDFRHFSDFRDKSVGELLPRPTAANIRAGRALASPQ